MIIGGLKSIFEIRYANFKFKSLIIRLLYFFITYRQLPKLRKKRNTIILLHCNYKIKKYIYYSNCYTIN